MDLNRKKTNPKINETNFLREDYSRINFLTSVFFKNWDAPHKQLTSFLEFVSYNTVLPLTTDSTTISGDIYAKLRKKGTPVDDIDILIAGIAITNDLVLVTNNHRDFEKIEGLEIVDWSQS